MATSNLTNDIIATTDKGGRLNITAHDRCAQRLTQARSIISLLEQTALRAAEDKDRLELSPAQLAETLWAARELIEQAQEASRQAYTGLPVRVVA